ncbi:MAG: hypothetical protein AAB197_07380 [Deltaproteobacteria bacterium]
MKIFLFTLLLFLCAPVWACDNSTGDVEPGMEIICPEKEETPKELEEMGLVLGLELGDMMIIDEFICKIPSSNEEGLWCEHRIDDTTKNLYLIFYIDESREEIRAVLMFEPKTKEMNMIYAGKKAGL